jgi:DMSO/TMAO reductase YedYZ molybdopterin-dependent catalytic subunit
MASKLTRRDFLKLGAVGGSALLLGKLLGNGGPADLSLVRTFFKVPIAPSPSDAAVSTTSTISDQCNLSFINIPRWPSYIPRRAELDPATGLHMTGSPVDINLTSYRLKVTGKVDHPLSLSYDDLRCMRKMTSGVDIVCKGYFEDFSTWAGVTITDVLDRAGIQTGATAINMKAGDGYVNQASVTEASSPDAFLAYEWVKGQPLPILFGFPLRAVFPEQGGYYDVKWLLEMEIV